MNQKVFAARLRDVMAEKKLTQTEVARLVAHPQPTVNRWVAGKFAPHPIEQDAILSKLKAGPIKLSERVPESLIIELGGVETDIRRVRQLVRLKNNYKSKPDLTRLVVQTMFDVDEATKLIKWFEKP